jgi:predicted nucleotidyltransferase
VIDGKLILMAVVGSKAYGTDREGSDTDYRGVYAADPVSMWKLRKPQQTVDRREPDIVVYELERFCKLAAAANPNVLEILYARFEGSKRQGRMLVSNREVFLSRRARQTYGGYARAQLRKAQEGTGGSRGREHFKREKFMLHLYRLMEQGTELLRTGHLNVRVRDPEALRAAAAKPMHEAELEFDRLDREMQEAADESPLPETPDMDAVDELLVNIRRSML